MSDTTLAVSNAPLVKASTELSIFLGMESGMMIDTIKAQCFKGKSPDQVTDAQLATYISVANALKLNPLLPGMMYPYPDRNGSVTVMLGPDGIYTLLANNPELVATKDGEAAWGTSHGKDEAGKETCTAYINHKTKGLLKKTIWVDEWAVESNPNWKARRKHMAEIRALKQCARQVIHGLPFDEDERRMTEEVNVTPIAETQSERPKSPARSGAAKAKASAGSIETTAVPVAETKIVAEVVLAEVSPPAEKPVTGAAPEGNEGGMASATPQWSQADGEQISGIFEIKEFKAEMVKSGGEAKPTVIAQVSSPVFTGKVYDVGGATLNADPALPPVAVGAWKVGASVHLILMSKKKPDKPANIFVKEIKALDQAETLD
jgi:hypothetical protein